MSTENLIRKLAGRTPKFLDNDKYKYFSVIIPVLAEVINVLIKAGAEVGAKDRDGWTPLMLAAKDNNAEVLNVLAQATGSDDFIRLLCVGTPQQIEEAIQGGVDVNAETNADWTPLKWAARNTNIVLIPAKIGYECQ